MKTESDEADQVFTPTEDRYRLLAENVSDVIFTFDLNLHHTYCSPSVERLRGYTAEEVMSQTLDQVLTPDSFKRVRKVIDKERIREKVKPDALTEPYTLALELTCKDGGSVWAEVKVSVLWDCNGEPTGILGVARDITERRRAEEALAGSQFRLLEAVDLAKIVFWELDWAGETFTFNDYFYALYGTTAKREGGYRMATREYVERFIHPDDREMVRKSAERNRLGQEPEFLVDLEHRIVRRDGEVRCILARTRGFRDASGQIIRCYGANQDITDRKRLEGQMLHTQKMEAIGTASAGIAHDFKGLLAAIEGFANLGIKHVQNTNKTKYYLDQITGAVERGKDLVRQILAFTQKDEDEFRTFDLIPVVTESIRMLRAGLLPAIEIQEDLTVSTAIVFADPTQLQQIIMNLITNGAHAMGQKGGTLVVGLSDFTVTSRDIPAPNLTVGPYIRLSISDTGTGMNKQTMDRIFDPFFTTKKRSEGTGLGLWVVHNIVKKHKGAITVKSTPGEGSTFDIFLPCSAK